MTPFHLGHSHSFEMRTLKDITTDAIIQDIIVGKVHYHDLEVLADDLKETLKEIIYSYDFMIASYNIMEPLSELVLKLATFSQIFVLERPGPEPRIKEKYVRIKYKYDTECTLIRPDDLRASLSGYYQSLVSAYEMRKEAEIACMIKSWGINNHA